MLVTAFRIALSSTYSGIIIADLLPTNFQFSYRKLVPRLFVITKTKLIRMMFNTQKNFGD